MIPKGLLLPALLVSAFAIPIALHKDGLRTIQRGFASWWQTNNLTTAPEPKPPEWVDASDIRQLAGPTANLDSLSTGMPVEGEPVGHLSEVIRFNVTPQWVMHRWPRVTTELSDLNLEGLRVPLVTGTAPHDLAGSLTYYFDNQQLVQRITFHGFTADERPLVELLVKKCGFRAEPTLGRGLYLAKWSGKTKSALWVQHAPVVQAKQRMTQLELELELNRPGRGYGLSERFSDLLAEQQRTGRW